jgi:hypothetical protein
LVDVGDEDGDGHGEQDHGCAKGQLYSQIVPAGIIGE